MRKEQGHDDVDVSDHFRPEKRDRMLRKKENISWNVLFMVYCTCLLIFTSMRHPEVGVSQFSWCRLKSSLEMLVMRQAEKTATIKTNSISDKTGNMLRI